MSRRNFNNSAGQSRSTSSSSYGNCEHQRQRLRCGGAATGNDGYKRLDDSTMIIGDADNANSATEDVHVRELRRMFKSCDDDGDGALTASGLERLCEELRLDEHKEYIVSQLLPGSSNDLSGRPKTIDFDLFKLKFIQLLPEVVDFSTGTERTKPRSAAATSPTSGRHNLRVPGNNESGSNSSHSRSGTGNRHQKYAERSNRGQPQHQQPNTSPRPIAAPRRRLLAGGMAAVVGEGPTMASDQDTSNDILSDFSDDDRHRNQQRNLAMQKKKNRSSLGSDSAGSSNASSGHQSPSRQSDNRVSGTGTAEEAAATTAATITASDVEQILNGLGLADRGYLGRYEFRILCQHLGLSGLTAAELNGLFNQLDKDGDGRIAVDDFLLVCPTTHPSSPAPSVSGGQQRRRNSCQDSGSHQQQEISNKDGDERGQRTPRSQADGVRTQATVSVASIDRSAVIGDLTTNSLTLNFGPLAITIGSNLAEKMKALRTMPVTLFGCLDEGRTGHTKREDVLQYLEKLTISIEDGCEILKKLGFPERQRWIDVKELSAALDLELCQNIEHNASLLAAVLTLKAEVCFLGEVFNESREQASHYLRELQQLNQRNAILVEEMDQNQQNLEIRSQLQLRELEEKHQGRISAIESKYREERDQWHTEIREKEEFLHKLEQTETALQNRLRQLERENGKLRTEVDDLSQMMKDVEDLNRDLRQALKDATVIKKRQSSVENVLAATGHAWASSNRTGLQSAIGDEALRKVMGIENGTSGSRTGLVIRRSTTNAKSSASTEVSAGCWRCASTSSTPTKKRVKYTPPSTSALLKRRRLQLNHSQNRRTSGGQTKPLDSSDFESEPEPIIFKPKFKRPLKKRQRLALIANRDMAMHTEMATGNALFSVAPLTSRSTSTSSEEEEQPVGAIDFAGTPSQNGYHNGIGANNFAGYCTYFSSVGVGTANNNRENQFHNLVALESRLSDERKFYTRELKVEIAAMEEEHTRECRRLLERFEREKELLKNECKRELEALIHAATSEKRAALEAQEADLRKQYESQRRDAEIKWATERNVVERKFAEEKMEMMERLQNDFEAELSRLRVTIANKSHESAASPATSMENRMRFEQVLRENVQLNAQLENLRTDLKNINENLESERIRNAEMEKRIAELQKEIVYWEPKYNESIREKLALHGEIKRVTLELQEVSAELTILQHRAEEVERLRLEETTKSSRVNSSDVDVQTDRSSLVAVKDESVQLEASSTDITINGVDPATALIAYERIHESLTKGVKDLEVLLQSGESGFEEEGLGGYEDAMETVEDPIVLKMVYEKLKKRLSEARAKFEEIRTELIGEAACLNEIRLSGDSTADEETRRPNSAPTVTIAIQETQTDDEDDLRERIIDDIDEEDEELDEIDIDGRVFGAEINGMKMVSSPGASPAVVAEVTERLRDENFLLRARLLEQKRLTGQLTDQLQQQMRDTVKVSEVAQKLFARCKSLESEHSKKHHIL